MYDIGGGAAGADGGVAVKGLGAYRMPTHGAE